MSELSAHSQSVKTVRLTDWVTNASTKPANQPQVQDSRVERETRPVSRMGISSNITTEISRSNTTPACDIVPSWTHSKEPSKTITQYSVQPNASQPQPIPETPVPMPLLA